MAWDFETDPDFQRDLDWMSKFVSEEVEPVDMIIDHPNDFSDPNREQLIKPLQERVQDRGLWACHLDPDIGGPGYGQLKLALMNEILGRSKCAPVVFGCQAPDSGNAEIIARYGTEEQKRQYLEPLLANTMCSSYSMTEPQGGADPKVFKCRAELIGDEWVINGEKWFSSNARYAELLVVMAVSNPNGPTYERMSMYLVPMDTPGIEIVRNVAVGYEKEGAHAYIRYNNVRIPRDHILGKPGEGFLVAQTRLGGGRIHHAMRTVGLVRKAFDMMCERVLSRQTQGEVLADKQLVQAMIADSWIEIESFRLLVLRTAWKIDKLKDYKQVRADISAVKAAMPRVCHDVYMRAMQIHGSIGASTEMPFASGLLSSMTLGMADGPTEVHKVTLAKQVLRGYKGTDELFPDYHLIKRREAAIERYANLIELEVGND